MYLTQYVFIYLLFLHTLKHDYWQISVLERANGGVTLFLHAVSAKPKRLSDTDITVDVYFTPRELLGNKKLSADIAHFVHQFSTKIAQPHLERFLLRCQYNAVTPPLRKGVHILLSVLIIVSIIFLSLRSTTLPKSRSSPFYAWNYPWIYAMQMSSLGTRDHWISYYDK